MQFKIKRNYMTFEKYRNIKKKCQSIYPFFSIYHIAKRRSCKNFIELLRISSVKWIAGIGSRQGPLKIQRIFNTGNKNYILEMWKGDRESGSLFVL